MTERLSHPYRTPESQLGAGTTEEQPLTLSPATTGRRLANYFLDGLFAVVAIVIVVFIVAFFIALIAGTSALGNKALDPWINILTYPALVAYYAVFEWAFGKTPAKFITKTTALNADGTRLTLGRAIARSLCRLIPFEPFSFLGGDRPRGWHDRLPKTIVVLDQDLKAAQAKADWSGGGEFGSQT